VVSSQLALLSWGWEVNIDRMLGQADLVRDHLGDGLREEIAAASSPFDRHLMTWCVENLVPLRQFKPGEIHVAFYERFCVEPESELARLSAFLGRPFDGRVITKLGMRSVAAPAGSSDPIGRAKIDGWVPAFPQEETERTTEVLRRFGLGDIYAEGPMPVATDTGTVLGQDRVSER
jgi:hypothetical protein